MQKINSVTQFKKRFKKLVDREVKEGHYSCKSKGLITWAGLARLAELVWVCRDLTMFVKRNKNQLRDYMTTGPAHTEAVWLTGPALLM